MKCVETCGFDQKPDSLELLVRHVESCSNAAPVSDKMVVWRGGEFVVVSDLGEDEVAIENVSFKSYEDAPIAKALVVVQPAQSLGILEEEVVVVEDTVVEEPTPEEA